MPYGLKYFAEFNTISSQNLTFRLEISKKNFTGDEQEITLTATGCVQEWQEDNPFAPIKGCTLNIGIINDGTVSLDDFYSEEDDEFYVELIRTDTMMTLFRGYILQDDSQEVVLEYAHEINIVATDNLGTLKDVLLNDAAAKFGNTTTYTGIDITAEGQSFITDRPEISGLKPGQLFSIDTSLYIGNYTCIGIEFQNPVWIINVGKPLPNFGYQTSDIIIKNPVELNDYVSLLTLVRLCLKSTEISTYLKVATNIYPEGGSIERWLDSTIILGSTFQNNDKWDNCYDVLEKIMKRFNATLFQSWGQWYIVRFGELFAGYNRTPSHFAIIGDQYTNDFAYLTTFNENHLFDINANEVETGLLKSIIRPYKFITETFNYDQQTNLIKNTNLQNVGNLLNQYQVGTLPEYNTVYEYASSDYIPLAPVTTSIFVVKDQDGKEVERTLSLKGQPTVSWWYLAPPGIYYYPAAIKTNEIQVSKDTKFSLSFDFRTERILSAFYPTYFYITLFDGTNTYTLRSDLSWQFGTGTVGLFYINYGTPNNDWQNFSIDVKIPFDGVLTIYFPQSDLEYFEETYFRNIKFNISGYIVNGQITIGHSHTETQTAVIKNSLENEIKIDDAPNNLIRGALFIDQTVAGIQQMTNNWVFKCGELINKNITLQTTNLELPIFGTFYGFIFEGCQIYFNPGDEFTLSGFNEEIDRTWVVEFIYNYLGLNYVFVVGAEFPSTSEPLTGTIEYNEPDKVFTTFGEYSVKEQLFNFQKPRYKYNGTLLFINRDERTISNLSLFNFALGAYNNNNVMPVGSIAIDYRNEIANFTMWALFEQLGDPWCDFANFVNNRFYNFSYIYDIKQ